MLKQGTKDHQTFTLTRTLIDKLPSAYVCTIPHGPVVGFFHIARQLTTTMEVAEKTTHELEPDCPKSVYQTEGAQSCPQAEPRSKGYVESRCEARLC